MVALGRYIIWLSPLHHRHRAISQRPPPHFTLSPYSLLPLTSQQTAASLMLHLRQLALSHPGHVAARQQMHSSAVLISLRPHCPHYVLAETTPWTKLPGWSNPTDELHMLKDGKDAMHLVLILLSTCRCACVSACMCEHYVSFCNDMKK